MSKVTMELDEEEKTLSIESDMVGDDTEVELSPSTVRESTKRLAEVSKDLVRLGVSTTQILARLGKLLGGIEPRTVEPEETAEEETEEEPEETGEKAGGTQRGYEL